jgi:ribosomal-protein-alanine N-acetyltransferase
MDVVEDGEHGVGIPDVELVGPTLSLRPLRREDVPDLFVLGADPEVTRWFSWGPYRSLDEPRAYVEDQLGRRARGEQLDLLMVHHEDGPVGVTGLSELSLRDRRAIVGTWFGRRWWGTGLNLEAKALVAHLAFAGCGLERLGAYADVRHERSQRALEKVGFRQEGVLRAFHRHGDVQKDVALFALLRADWQTSPLTAVPTELRGEVPPAFAVPAP